MTKKLHGKIHGKTIELVENPGVEDGQEVELQMEIIPARTNWGDGIRRSAGGWADFPEMDDIMKTIYEARKLERRSDMERE